MKKNKVFLLVLLVLLMLCTACGEKKEEPKKGIHFETKDVEKKEEEKKEEKKQEEEKKLSFICSNDAIKIETPNTWKKYTGEQMNKDSCVELLGTENDKVLLIISEKKSLFNGFKSWFDIVYGTAKKSYDLDDSQIRRSDEGGLNTRFIEKELAVDEENVYLQLYFMETNNYYNQVLMWTEASNKDLLGNEFRSIAYSLREIE